MLLYPTYIYAMSRNLLSTEMTRSAKGSSINTKQYLVYWSVLEALDRTLLTIGTAGSLDLTSHAIRACEKVFYCAMCTQLAAFLHLSSMRGSECYAYVQHVLPQKNQRNPWSLKWYFPLSDKECVVWQLAFFFRWEFSVWPRLTEFYKHESSWWILQAYVSPLTYQEPYHSIWIPGAPECFIINTMAKHEALHQMIKACCRRRDTWKREGLIHIREDDCVVLLSLCKNNSSESFIC